MRNIRASALLLYLEARQPEGYGLPPEVNPIQEVELQ